MINIVLVEPEIPQNTGNIARTCACTGSALHLVRPFGFEISDRTVKRAGLDYWDKVNITYYDSLSDFLEKHKGDKLFYLTTKAKKSIYDVEDYPDDCYLLFGKETKGLPEELIYSDYENAVRIPMIGELRSLNLANSVAIVLYETLRRHDFFGKDVKIEK
ncbi:MAG: tRNA (uridine(34)/cytosine(34)/5-carboxymethylaminomethyluridine(34)-2'-O)-methyltransferase TrmL [Firmicutes bacterium]|nr:tRNA (uridine(34)/cytosine(34)/5-carboxymethylaminomethyluridine(34)-2'-O)-methyltransferase TrmL [Bacillota bacterium]MDY5531272.1 tRNA (uridine(34)/cytosine(34)/5-carboxymethylaminomethyluridine(34)-2'-O)-methyltransferase TrmL [Pumilibacteraceae bacterium]